MSNTPQTLNDTVDPHETLSRDEAHAAHVHITPYWPMFWVFVLLLAFTALTVWSSNIHHLWIGNTEIVLGTTLHILIAMTIAVIKAALVAAYFMHLRYDQPMNTVVAGATVFAVILFIGLTVTDSGTRNVIDPIEHVKVVAGGDGHFLPDGSVAKGKGTVDAARENAKAEQTKQESAPAEPAGGTQ